MSKPITTAKVAKIAGVSQATVSRVLNGGTGVAPEKLQAVRAALELSGYKAVVGGRGRPVGSVVNGAGKRVATGTIALIMGDDAYTRHPSLALAKIQGVQRAANEAGLNLLVAEIREGDPLPPMLAEGKVDGILLWGRRAPRRLIASMGNAIVWISSSHHGGPGAGVMPGNEIVGRLAASYLLEQGHRDLAFLSLAPLHPGYESRGEGFEYAAHRGGAQVKMVIEAPDNTLAGGNYSGANLAARGRRLVDRLLALSPRPTAIFVADDELTATIYPVLFEKGLQPGTDLKIISCNNEEPYLAGLHPRPATIDLAPEVTGRRAVEELLWRIRNPEETRRVQVMVEPVLILGETDERNPDLLV
jgi:DNA-binding LacI/PurR family transcriptional regulator